eukprot:TRINITY_DN6911_c0_g1_i1.p1 TRINITY_DN6911_c0_g1~~TRINITY_DN6911_c0_g1_i1.p1  ORF type:complete len:108 (+),score=20.21 TRINITY_DN6911_c0_g1_i1:175-498(+)
MSGFMGKYHSSSTKGASPFPSNQVQSMQVQLMENAKLNSLEIIDNLNNFLMRSEAAIREFSRDSGIKERVDLERIYQRMWDDLNVEKDHQAYLLENPEEKYKQDLQS